MQSRESPESPESRQSSRGTRLRRRAGLIGLGLAGLGTAITYTPPLSFAWWVPRLVGRELALLIALLALAAAILLARTIGKRTWRIGLVALAGSLSLVGSLPFSRTLPLFGRHGVYFSLSEYVLGVGVPPGIREDHDVVLASDRPELVADVYRPAQAPATPSPGVVVIHGGSFQFGDKGDAPQVSRALAAAGFAVFDLRYRLAPKHPFPAAVQDVLCALGRLAEPAARERFAVDGRRLAVLGRSAGGTLALNAAYAAAAQAAVPVGQAQLPSLRAGCAVVDVAPRAVVAIYPWTDLRAVHDQPPRPDTITSRESMRAYLGGSPEQLAGPYAHASPIFYASRADLPRGVLPPTLLVHGQGDSMVLPEQSDRLFDALTRSGHTPKLLSIPGAEHGFDQRPGGTAEQLERALVLRFLQQTL